MISALSSPISYKLGQWDYVAGTYNGYPVVVCRTEQGLANTGASTALAMEFFNASAVIDQGTSGGHDPALHTYDIVLGKRTVNYCAWKTAASAKGAGVDYTAFEMNGVYAYDRDEATFTQSVYHYADTALLKAANTVKSGYTSGSVVEGTIGTSNEWNNQIDRMLYLNKTVGTSCEEMETDAAAQICQTYSVPYLGVRILSNTGIYAEGFDWKTGAACQNYVLSVAGQYISNLR
jgi:Nucleoside phosphorylase